ncbi:MAG: NosD domain-containing protein [Candidatus Hodarchaeota archaeon]
MKHTYQIKRLFPLITLALIGLFFFQLNIEGNDKIETNNSFLRISNPHPVISITSEADLLAFPNKTGNGTISNPYIIENLEIDALGTGSPILISDTFSHLVIRNCTLNNSGTNMQDAGIRLYNCTNLNITNCTIYDNENGLYLRETINCNYSSNNIRNNFYGIQTLNTNNTLIFGNNITNNSGSGLYLDVSNSNNVSYNNISDNDDYGIYSSYSIGNIIEDNILVNHTEPGIYLFWSNSETIASNNITQYNKQPGIMVYATQGSSFTSNQLFGCGFIFDGMGGSTIASHVIPLTNYVNGKLFYFYADQLNLDSSNFTDPGQIVLANCNNSLISGFNITNTTAGIILYNCEYNNITNNSVMYNQHGIILAYYSRYNNIDLNNVSFNEISGLNLFIANFNNLTRNNASDGGEIGARLMASNNNTIVENELTRNYLFGAYVDSGSVNNTIYFNRLENNTWSEAYCENSTNYWDNSTTGNYWGDYLSLHPSASNDGYVWNESYSLNGTTGLYDNYPLVTPYVFDYKPVANFTANFTTIVEGQFVQFNFTGIDGSSPATFQWNFGDGSPNSTALNPIHQYNSSGNYTVGLSVNDSMGYVDFHSISNFIVVFPDVFPLVNFTVNSTTVVEGGTLQFNFTGALGNLPLSFYWNFGDGTPNSSLQDPTHTFSNPGFYNVSLYVVDTDGDTDFLQIVDYVEVTINAFPVASFTHNGTKVLVGDWIQFNFTGSEGDAPAVFYWEFGDSRFNSTARDPVFQFTIKGNHSIRLVVRDSNNDLDVELQFLIVETRDSDNGILVIIFVILSIAVVGIVAGISYNHFRKSRIQASRDEKILQDESRARKLVPAKILYSLDSEVTVFEPRFIELVESCTENELASIELLSFFKTIKPDDRIAVFNEFLDEYKEFEEEF